MRLAVVRRDHLRRELELPYGEGEDHAEGISWVEDADGRALLVVHDSPSAQRLDDGGGVHADVVRLPTARPLTRHLTGPHGPATAAAERD